MSSFPAPDDLRSETVTRLRAAGCVFAEDEADLLIAEAASAGDLDTMVARRVGGLPLEQVLGWAEFCGLRVAVDPGVFVPRRRTGLLVREAAALVRAGSVVVDLCCGSGAVGVALLASVPGLELYAADVDPAAVRSARRNVEPQGGQVVEGDLYAALPAALRGRVDVVVANAPYVPTDGIALMPPEARLHEARVALDGGGDGVDVQRRVATGAPGWLAASGHLLVETGRSQVTLTVAAFEAAGLTTRVVTDDDLEGTVVIGAPGPA